MLMLLSLVAVSSSGIKEDKIYELDDNTIPYDLDLDLPDFISDEFYKYTLYEYQNEKNHMFYIKDDSEVKETQNNVHIGILDIKCGFDTYQSLIKEYGLPTKVLLAMPRDTVFSEDVKNKYFLNIYYGDVQLFFGVDNNILREIRFHERTSFSYEDNITVGSTLDEVLSLYPAKNIIEDQEIKFNQSYTLFKNIKKQDGYHYINYPDKKLRLFFSDNKISALYIY